MHKALRSTGQMSAALSLPVYLLMCVCKSELHCRLCCKPPARTSGYQWLTSSRLFLMLKTGSKALEAAAQASRYGCLLVKVWLGKQ